MNSDTITLITQGYDLRLAERMMHRTAKAGVSMGQWLSKGREGPRGGKKSTKAARKADKLAKRNSR